MPSIPRRGVAVTLLDASGTLAPDPTVAVRGFGVDLGPAVWRSGTCDDPALWPATASVVWRRRAAS